jgi:hypothetical protein
MRKPSAFTHTHPTNAAHHGCAAGTVVRLCDSRFTTPGEFDQIAYMANTALSQRRALLSILKIVAPGLSDKKATTYSKCTPTPTVQPIVLQQPGYKVRWYVNCTLRPFQVTTLSFRIDIAGLTLRGLPDLTDALVNSLLLLRKSLQNLDMVVYGGTLPVKLGALSRLQRLIIYYYCLIGGLPANLLLGLQSASEVTIRQYAGAEQYQPFGVQCGITGPVPPEWFIKTQSTTTMPVWQQPGKSLQVLDLSSNRLTGYLPDITAWTQLQMILLSNNEFSGGVSTCDMPTV